MWKRIVADTLECVDRSIAQLGRPFFRSNTLTILLLHAISSGNKDVSGQGLDPVQVVTVQDLEKLLECCRQHGVTFVSPDDIERGRTPRRSVLLTFDDGYFNNHLAFDVLRRQDVPCVVFVSTAHIESGMKFWWDVIHTERLRQGRSLQEISQEKSMLKGRPYYDIARYIDDTFGRDSWHPIGDLDRPMSRQELTALAGQPLITIGNHTAHHAILTTLSPDEVRAEIDEAEEFIASITGARSGIISYPNGNCSPGVRDIASQLGMRLGITVRRRNNRLPVCTGQNALRLSRFVISCNQDIAVAAHECITEPRYDSPSVIERLVRHDSL